MNMNPSAKEYTPSWVRETEVASSGSRTYPTANDIQTPEVQGESMHFYSTPSSYSSNSLPRYGDPYAYNGYYRLNNQFYPSFEGWGSTAYPDHTVLHGYPSFSSFNSHLAGAYSGKLSPALQLARKKKQEQEEQQKQMQTPPSSSIVSPPCPTSPDVNLTEKKSASLSVPPSPADPLVLLFLGCRGAGKSTFSKMAAEKYNLIHLSSGEMCQQVLEPFVELKKIVLEEFGEGGRRRYAGIALDRFVALSEIDAYYLQDSLSAANLPVPLAVWLQVDISIGLERAELRDLKKSSSLVWRQEEKRIQSNVAEKIFRPSGSLLSVDTNHRSLDDIFTTICLHIDSSLSGRRAANVFSLPETEWTHSSLFSAELVKDYGLYKTLCRELHNAVGNFSSRIDSPPLSSMGSYMDNRVFSSTSMIEKCGISSSYVTLKVDGERFLLLKHREKGYFVFPFKFTHCFSVDEYLKNINLAPCPPVEERSRLMKKSTEVVDFILDTEICLRNGEGVFYIIDFVYLFTAQGTKMRFAERYNLLQKVFQQYCHVNKPPLVLKRYVPINQLKFLLPAFDKAPVAIDGIVFQHGDVYCFGLDKLLFKWKPKELCTADFRLANKRKEEEGKWVFDLIATKFSNNAWAEEIYEGATLACNEEEVTRYNLENGMITELFLERRNSTGDTEWKVCKLRPDKLFPNKSIIVDAIMIMEHLNYEELLEKTAAIKFQPLIPSSFPKYFHK